MTRVLWRDKDMAVLRKAVADFESLRGVLPVTTNDYNIVLCSLPAARRVPYTNYRMHRILIDYLRNYDSVNDAPKATEEKTNEPNDRQEEVKQPPPVDYKELEGKIYPEQFFFNTDKDTTVYTCDKEGNLVAVNDRKSVMDENLKQYIDAVVEKAVIKHLTSYIGPVVVPTTTEENIVESFQPVFDKSVYSKETQVMPKSIEKTVSDLVNVAVETKTKSNVVNIPLKKKILTIGFKPGQQKNIQQKYITSAEFTHVDQLSQHASSFGSYDLIIMSKYNGHNVNEVLINRYKVPKEKIVFIKGGVSSLSVQLAKKIEAM